MNTNYSDDFSNEAYVKNIKNKCLGGVYENYVSLGRNCHVASDLERLCLRSFSGPFDWNFTKWKTIERAFNGDLDFVEYKKLRQNRQNPSSYANPDYDITFVHDFHEYLPLIFQYKKVREKYKRRSERFLSEIQKPTLFLRYCANQNELAYIEGHFDDVLALIRKSNPENDIVFISHFGEKYEIPSLFYIELPDGQTSSRKPVLSNAFLAEMLSQAVSDKKESNRGFQAQKQKNKDDSKENRPLYIRIMKKLHIRYRHYRSVDPLK